MNGLVVVSAPAPLQNRLLAALTTDTRERLLPHLELVSLPLGAVMHEFGAPWHHAYFPIDAIVSQLYELTSGESTEVSVIGNDGLVGIALLLGDLRTPSRAVVHSPGFAYRLRKKWLREEFNRHGEFMRLVLRYTQLLMTQMSQTAVCNRRHTIDRQLCRWLLLSLDRVSSHHLAMTHELIAQMLGVRRESVTQAAARLQQRGIISYSRGHVTVLDRAGLEALSCECYAMVRKETDRLLPYLRPEHRPYVVGPLRDHKYHRVTSRGYRHPTTNQAKSPPILL